MYHRASQCSDQNEQAEEHFTFVAMIPQKWKPRLFLALLNKSILEHKVIYLERVIVGDTVYFSLNALHFYFPCGMNTLHEFLLEKVHTLVFLVARCPISESWILC